MTDIIHYALWKTPLGNLFAASTDEGLCALRLCEDQRQVPEFTAEISARHGNVQMVEDAEWMRPLLRQIDDVLAGRATGDTISLDPAGTQFQKRVWKALVKVPWGKTLSYSELAKKAGNPKAIRAVASACARNPIAFVVPCHRVLHKGGGLGGYYWGLQMKQQLLERERA